MRVQSIGRFFVGALGIACGAMFVLLLRGAAIVGATRAEATHAALLVHGPSTHPAAALLVAEQEQLIAAAGRRAAERERLATK